MLTINAYLGKRYKLEIKTDYCVQASFKNKKWSKIFTLTMITKGDINILGLHKTAFLCSQKCPADIVLKSFDWAKQERTAGNCVVCGNHSQIEKDVFEILLRGKQPLILVLPRSLKKRWEPEILKAVNENRLLVISPFDEQNPNVVKPPTYVVCRHP